MTYDRKQRQLAVPYFNLFGFQHYAKRNSKTSQWRRCAQLIYNYRNCLNLERAMKSVLLLLLSANKYTCSNIFYHRCGLYSKCLNSSMIEIFYFVTGAFSHSFFIVHEYFQSLPMPTITLLIDSYMHAYTCNNQAVIQLQLSFHGNYYYSAPITLIPEAQLPSFCVFEKCKLQSTRRFSPSSSFKSRDMLFK